MKINLSINPKATQMPLSVSKGTEAQRFQKAAELSEKFIEKLKKEYIFGDKVSRTEFSNLLKQTVDSPISISVEQADKYYPFEIGYNISKDAVVTGFNLPLVTEKNKISKNSSISFIKRVQAIFSRLYNPKVTRREIAVFNVPNGNKILMLEKKMLSKQDITEKEIREAIKGLKPQQKIDVLQLLRYRLKIADNIQKTGLYATSIDKSIKIEKAPYEHWKYDAKSELLNERLLKLIRKERLKTKTP